MRAIRYITVSMLLMGCLTLVQAQESEAVNVKKQLKAVMKEMPYEAQLEVLRYAERKKDALAAVEAKRKEMATQSKVATNAKPVVQKAPVLAAPDQKKAMPQPAQPVEAKPVQVRPANSARK